MNIQLKLKINEILFNIQYKIPDCTSISNNCYISQSKNAICQNGPQIKQPGYSCLSIQEDQQTCQNIIPQQSSFYCNEIIEAYASPILCAQALGICRFDGIKCVNTYPNECDNTYPNKVDCNKSYSKELCEKCGCNFDYLGYCQKLNQNSIPLPPQLNQDCSNKYYLCYEVTQFVTQNKQKVCGLVDQACKFTDKCEDATHSIVLIKCISYILAVNYFACLRCTGLAMKYDNINLSCVPIDSEIGQCENLNKQACLSFSKSFKCQWLKFESSKCNQKKYEVGCKMISDIKATDKYDCSSLNYEACNQEQQNLCWFNLESKLCQKYNPLIGNCNSYKNKSTCNLSMVESCKWNGEKCQSELNPQSCQDLNKFGCLNFQQLPCVWSDNLLKCESAKYSTPTSSCNQFLLNQSDYTLINVDKSCILSKNYKCREILEPQLYECETQGLNKKACLLKTKNSCAFIENKCISMSNVHEGCKDYLNQVACLNQDATCKFNNGLCSILQISSIDDLTHFTTYSKNVCNIFDDLIGLIYSIIQNRCINFDNLKRKLTDCTEFGINKYTQQQQILLYTCLNKVESFCEYKEKKCQYIIPSDIKFCMNTLNQFACTQSKDVLCKFQNNQCYVFSETNDFNCAQQQSKYWINPQICYADKKNPCYFNSIVELQKIIFIKYFTNKTKQCEFLIEKSIHQQCTGLNRQACIFYSQELVCQFNETEKKCESSFGYSICSDSINKNKCLAIITKGQYCQFNETQGCEYLDKSVDIHVCQNSIKTNPSTIEFGNVCNFHQILIKFILVSYFIFILFSQAQLKKKIFLLNIKLKSEIRLLRLTYLFVKLYSHIFSKNVQHIYNSTCSQSLDVPCFHDKNQKSCIEYKNLDNLNNIDDSSMWLNYQLSNIYSFNKKTCEQFDKEIFLKDSHSITKDVLLFWKESCIQVHSAQLLYLKCDQNLNKNACISIEQFEKIIIQKKLVYFSSFWLHNIKTPFQYCQYKNNKCINVDLKDYINTPCESIKNINSGAICSQTSDVACQFDPFLFSCKRLTIDSSNIPKIDCDERNPEQKGYNKLACSLDINNCLFKEQCYKINNVNIQFCENAIDKIQCQQVQIEGCIFNQNKCIKIQFSDYYTLTCESAINKIGCTARSKHYQTSRVTERCSSSLQFETKCILCSTKEFYYIRKYYYLRINTSLVITECNNQLQSCDFMTFENRYQIQAKFNNKFKILKFQEVKVVNNFLKMDIQITIFLDLYQIILQIIM